MDDARVAALMAWLMPRLEIDDPEWFDHVIDDPDCGCDVYGDDAGGYVFRCKSWLKIEKSKRSVHA